MTLIKNRTVVDNTFRRLADADALPPSGDVLVSLERWISQHDALRAHSGQVGVVLTGEHDVREHAQLLLDRPVIALEFPKFADGRCYSHARILREQLGFTGELRAIGDVLRDQLFYLYRCGIDAFELAPGVRPDSALEGFRDFSVVYQPAADEPLPLFRRA